MFNPNAALEPNGNYFAFPYTPEQAKLVLVSVPWDVTTSYKSGAAKGPQAIMDASLQLDFYDESIEQAWKLGIGTLPLNESAGVQRSSIELQNLLAANEDNPESSEETVNNACTYLNDWVYETCNEWLNKGKKVGIVGGEHSVPLGLLKALSEKHSNFGILHLDAHADLRAGYEGFEFSHASIMYNALKLPQITKLIQVGIRDVSPAEMEFAQNNSHRITQFSDRLLQNALLEGQSWQTLCKKIIDTLPQNIYISFDIDVFDPSLCPHTGTPVAGGLSFAQARYLLEQLRISNKKIIGFDLCEVAPNPAIPEDEWDGNVGARALYMLSNTSIIC